MQDYQRKQNLVLFFNENHNEPVRSKNMVRLYMNRFIVDEEDQHEIIGVRNLTEKQKLCKRKQLAGKSFFFRAHNQPFNLKEHLKEVRKR